MNGRSVLLCGRSFSGARAPWRRSLRRHYPVRLWAWTQTTRSAGCAAARAYRFRSGHGLNELAHERVRTRLDAGGTVILDDTSSPPFLRDRWRAESKAAGAGDVLVFVETPEALIRQRLLENRASRRRGDVTDEVMAAHQESFEPPGEGEQPLRLQVGSSPADLDGLCDAVRQALTQSH